MLDDIGPVVYRYRLQADYKMPIFPSWRKFVVESANSIYDADIQFWEAVGPTAILVSPSYEIAKMAIFPMLFLAPIYYAWEWISPLFT